MSLPFQKVFTLRDTLVVPRSLEETWSFFSNPYNLSRITPTSLNFRIVSNPPEEIYAGLIIRYLVSPFPGIDSQWVTEITHVDEGRLFVDEQRIGPYVLWHHQHRFREIAGGTEISDEVNYIVPGLFFGPLIHRLLIEARLKEIFSFRRAATSQIFSIPSAS